MINPYVLLAAGLVWLASCGYAYVTGSKNAANAAKAAYGESLKASIDAAHAQGVIDMQAEAENADERQKARIEYRDRTVTLERIIREKPTECSLPTDAVSLLNSAIDASNRQASAKSGTMPAPAADTVKPR